MSGNQSAIGFFRRSRTKTIPALLLAVLLALMLAFGLMPKTQPLAATTDKEISILFTHDVHAHLDSDRTMIDGKVVERGGFARMKTVIDDVATRYPVSLVLDAGDFAMGTIYQTIYSTEAPDLRMLGMLGYDATTLGNHEFDYRPQGLTDMLTVAAASKDYTPPIVIANIDWNKTFADEKRAEKAKALKASMDRYGVTNYLILERGGIKIAVFGLMGKVADSYAPESGLYFLDPIETAKKVVAEIKANTDADIIICLSHSGTDEDPKISEDELLAKAVPDIDVIISGHTHTKFDKPLVIGNTIVVCSGEHGYYLGHLVVVREGNRYKVSSYELIPVSENLAKSPEVEAAILGLRDLIDQQYLSKFGYQFDQVLAYSPYQFTPIDEFGLIQGEETLGNLISDSYIAAVKKAEGSSYRQVDVAIAPRGVIRGSFTKGPITVADAYNVSSLGIGPDRVSGYPLVSLYLTGAELKTAAEVDISVSTLMLDARLYMSGLSYTYNPNRLLLNRVTEVYLMSPDGTLSDLDDNKLYRVVGGLYSCQMLGQVEAKSFGLLKVTPKDENGNPIVDFEKHIIYDNGVELKEWVALADYLASFTRVDGAPQVPEYYSQPQNRKVEENSTSLVDLLKNPNKIFFILLGAIVLVVAIIITVIVLIVRIRRRLKRRRAARRAAAARSSA